MLFITYRKLLYQSPSLSPKIPVPQSQMRPPQPHSSQEYMGQVSDVIVFWWVLSQTYDMMTIG